MLILIACLIFIYLWIKWIHILRPSNWPGGIHNWLDLILGWMIFLCSSAMTFCLIIPFYNFDQIDPRLTYDQRRAIYKERQMQWKSDMRAQSNNDSSSSDDDFFGF